MDMRVTPHKRGTSPTCNPRHTQLGHPLLYPYFRQKVVLLPPPPLFFASDMKTRKNHWGGGGGAENTPTVPTNVTRGDEYCSPRHSKLRHPVLYPCPSPTRLINVGYQSVTCKNSLFFTSFCFSNFHHFPYAKSLHTNAAPPAPSSQTLCFVPRRGQLKPPDFGNPPARSEWGLRSMISK